MKKVRKDKQQAKLDREKVMHNKLRRMLGQWKTQLKAIVNKEANIRYRKETNTVEKVMPRTLIDMCFNIQMRDFISRAIQEEGAANVANVKSRLYGEMKRIVDKYLDDPKYSEFAALEGGRSVNVEGSPSNIEKLPPENNA